MIQVLIVEAFWACRAGWRTLVEALDEACSVVETDRAENVATLVREPDELDLILLGRSLPHVDVGAEIATLRRCVGDAPIVVLAPPLGRSEALRAIEIGAMGYIPKTVPAEDTLRGLRRVLAGEVWIAPEALATPDTPGRAPGSNSPGTSDGRLHGLTQRQRDVLSGLAQGKTNAQIAGALGLSTNTVRLHVSAILKTLGVSNRTQAARLATEFGAETIEPDTES